LAAGHVQRMHRWLMEGFAEWVSFKVVDRLGTQNFFTIKCGKHAAIK